jgi:hypothetical protein
LIATLRARADKMLRMLLAPLPDAWYLRVNFLIRTHRILRLKNPRAYSDKIQWLMLYGGLERYTSFADKYEVRRYVADTIGPEYLVPLVGVWDSFDDIPLDQLPRQFVLKATHGQGFNFVCLDKSAIDIASLRRTATAWLGENFYRLERERQYQNIRPRLIAEAYLEDDSGALRDYKFPCFYGEPYLVQVIGGRADGATENFYDRQWNSLQIEEKGFPNAPGRIARPAHLDSMFTLAAKLSSSFPFVRVDLYYAAGRIYFGELTFTPACGLISYKPRSVDYELGGMLDLSAFADNVQAS